MFDPGFFTKDMTEIEMKKKKNCFLKTNSSRAKRTRPFDIGN